MLPGPTTLVTGGAGYVGAATVHRLRQAGRPVVVLDNLERGHAAAVDGAELVVGDIRDRRVVENVIRTYGVGSILHFAGYKNAGESMAEPVRYFDTNVTGTLVVAGAALDAGIRKFVLSSSCAVYGTPEILPVTENDLLQPESPYGESKRQAEQILSWLDATGLRSVSLRYFNAAGASFDGERGEDWSMTQNLVPLAIKARLGCGPRLRVFGSDYPTADGTPVRDYVHVCDLAEAHVLALEYLDAGEPTTAINLGTGRPSSVFDVLDAIARVSGVCPPVELGPRRPGDPASVYADSSRAAAVLGWKARYGMDEIVRTAWMWHSRHPEGYSAVAA